MVGLWWFYSRDFSRWAEQAARCGGFGACCFWSMVVAQCLPLALPATMGACVVKMLYDSRSQGLEKCEEKLFLFIFCSNYPVFVTWSFYSFLCFFVLTKCLMSEFKTNLLECLNTCFHGKAFFEDTCEEESHTCSVWKGKKKAVIWCRQEKNGLSWLFLPARSESFL